MPDFDDIDLSAGFVDQPRSRRRTSGLLPELESHWSNLRTELERAGERPIIRSGFRTAAQQNALHRAGKPTKGNDGYVNISPHQEGRALDIGNLSDRGRRIVGDYARRAGLHVPSDEPWHIAIPKRTLQQSPIDLSAGFQGQVSPVDTVNTASNTAIPTATDPPSPVPDEIDLTAGFVEQPQPTRRRFSFAGVQAGVSGQQQSDPFALLKSINAQPAPRRRQSLGQAVTALPGIHQILNLLPEEERENFAEGVTGAVAGTARQLANTQELGMRATPIGYVGRKLLNQVGIEPRRMPETIRDAGQSLESAVAENVEQRPEPTTFTGQVRRGIGRGAGAASVELPKLILGGRLLGAANLPVQGALSRADEGVPGIVKGAAGGLVYHYGGQATGALLSKYAAPYLAKVGNSLVWIAGPTAERMITDPNAKLGETIGENVPFGIFAGAGGVRRRGQRTRQTVPDAVQEKLRRAEQVQVRDGETVRAATDADLTRILKRELEVVPPNERVLTPAIEAALKQKGYTEEQIQAIKSGGPIPEYAERDISPERIEDRAIETQEVPAVERGRNTVDETQLPVPTTREPSTQPQRFQHLQFGEVEVTADQSGARPGRLRVAEVANPEAIHYVKKADRQGRGNAQLLPIKEPTAAEPVLQSTKDMTKTPTTSESIRQPSPFSVEGERVTPLERRENDDVRVRYESGIEGWASPNVIKIQEVGPTKTWHGMRTATDSEVNSVFRPSSKREVVQPAAAAEKQRPPADDPLVTVYRGGELIPGKPQDYTTTREKAEKYGVVSEIRVPKSVLDKYRVSDFRHDDYYLITPPKGEVKLSKGGTPIASDKVASEAKTQTPIVSSTEVGAGGDIPLQGTKPAPPTSEPLPTVTKPNMKRMERDLRKRGISQSAIDKLTPQQAREILEPPRAERETIIPAQDTKIGQNDAGEQLYERADGKVYRMRLDRPHDRPYGYPDFGGDLAPVAQRAEVRKESPTPPSAAAVRELNRPATSVKNAATAELRRDLDLLELEGPERKSFQQTIDNAQRRGLDKQAEQIAKEVTEGKRQLSDEDEAGLQLRMRQLENQWEETYRRDPSSPELPDIKQRLDNLTRASRESGTPIARALSFRRSFIDKDYKLISVVRRVEEAKGRTLTADEFKRYENMTQELETLTAKLADAEAVVKQNAIQKDIDKIRRQQRRSETKQTLDDEFVELKTQFAQARAEARNVQASGLASLDPEGKLTPIIARMARNRVRAGVVRAEQVVDEVYNAVSEHVEGLTKRDVRDAISGYGLEPRPDRRSDAAKQLAQVRTELRQLSASEDVESGVRLSRQDKTRQTQLLKREADLQRRIEQKNYSRTERTPPQYTRETFRIQKRVEELKAKFENDVYQASRGTQGKVMDTVAVALNVPKTAKTIGDVSALGRQGGFLGLVHPIVNAPAIKDMARSATEIGAANVQREIQSHKDYDLLKRMGVEFTGVEEGFRREEGFLGSAPLKKIPVVREVTKFSENTFTNMLDAQRVQVGSYLYDQLRSPSKFAQKFLGAKPMTPESNPESFKAIARHINDATGRGNLGRKWHTYAPFLNAVGFSPRLVRSRFALLNKMFNPVAIARMPRGARRLIVQDNVKFLGEIAALASVVNAANAAGLTDAHIVWDDPDDSDFLKVTVGNTHWDGLMGLQQPTRFMIRLGKALFANIRQDETYAGADKGKILGDFARSKASPVGGQVWDYFEGKNRLTGKKFDFKDLPKETLLPLPADDFYEAMQEDGALWGAIKASPSLIGVGVQTYEGAAEKPKTHAEKLARKLIRDRLPDSARTQEEIDKSGEKSKLRLRARQGEDVSTELAALGLTDKQRESVEDAKGVTRLQEDFKRLSVEDAILVYGVMTRGERESTRELLQGKAERAMGNRTESEQAKLKDDLSKLGIALQTRRNSRPSRKSRQSRAEQ